MDWDSIKLISVVFIYIGYKISEYRSNKSLDNELGFLLKQYEENSEYWETNKLLQVQGTYMVMQMEAIKRISQRMDFIAILLVIMFLL
jgi:hypothetical protein